MINLENQLQRTVEFVSKALKALVLCFNCAY